MITSCTTPILERPFQNVKPSVNTQLPLFPDSVIHHKVERGSREYKVLYNSTPHPQSYGVSTRSKLLPVSLFRKKYEAIKLCLKAVVDLPDKQIEGMMRLLRIEAYYGRAYPKAAQIARDFDDTPLRYWSTYTRRIVVQRESRGCSRASFWRAIRRLKELGLVTVVNRYVLRPHAQISNLYRLDRLLLLIIRYLAEHGQAFYDKILKPLLAMPGEHFWSWIFGVPAKIPVYI